tara:strand:- start:112 stop:273 length:162 start_codon:yes stop_codon:yes gene_type:complete
MEDFVSPNDLAFALDAIGESEFEETSSSNSDDVVSIEIGIGVDLFVLRAILVL